MPIKDDNTQQDNRTLTSREKSQERSPDRKKGQVLIEWKSPSRPFRERSREYYTTGAAIIFLVSVILFLIQEWLAIGAVFSVAFVAYVLSTVPPEEAEHRITTFGIETVGHRYHWFELYEFWFEKKWGETILTIQTRISFPGKIHILLGDQKEEKVKDVLQDYLPFLSEPNRTFTDKVADWISSKIPLEASV